MLCHVSVHSSAFCLRHKARDPISVAFFDNLVPRVFSLSHMAAAGEKTLAHGRNHVTDLSTENRNVFKMAAKMKSERIWVRGFETGEKQTKWRQRQTQKKLKIWKNALTSHRNTVEWYSDLIFCSMTFICFKPERFSTTRHLTTVFNSISRYWPFFHCFFFCLLWVPEVQFSSFVKGGALSNRERNLFHLRNFENRPLKPRDFFVITL